MATLPLPLPRWLPHPINKYKVNWTVKEFADLDCYGLGNYCSLIGTFLVEG